MGSSPSSSQAQCPVQPVKQVQIPIGCKCGNDKAKWKCEVCVLLKCDSRKDKTHSDTGHIIIGTSKKINISDVKEYKTELEFLRFLTVSYDNSIWTGSGRKILISKHTSLQKIRIVGNTLKVISSFNMHVLDIAVNHNNDILLAINESRLMQIYAGSTYEIDSTYFVESVLLHTVHVTKDGRVIVGGFNGVVVVMDTDGNHLARYEKDQTNEQIFSKSITSITSTANGNIFVTSPYDNKLVVFGNTDIISIYNGHSEVNFWGGSRFSPSSVVTTPMDNVIVADLYSNTLHILNNSGHLLTTYNSKDMGISMPHHLAITTEGPFSVLFIATFGSGSLYKMVITGC